MIRKVLLALVFILGGIGAISFVAPLQQVQAQSSNSLSPIKAGDPLPANLFVELAKIVNPAVVNIFTTYLPSGRGFRGNPNDPFYQMFEQFMGPGGGAQRQPQQSLGTGFIIREDGLIVTNNHVIDQASIIKVQISENIKDVYDAKLIGKDSKTDIALIKIDAKKKLRFVKLGKSADVQVGEWVAAFGNPYGYGHTVTKGIISAIGREIDELNLNPFMQTDASINPGNSGGPLVNTQGEVIGVNTAIDARAQGIGFVIPIDNVKNIIPQLEKEGEVKRGFIGVQMADIDEDGARSINIKQSEGALITQVIPGSPAEIAGIQAYDLIINFGPTPVAAVRDLLKAVSNTPIGAIVPVKVIRNGVSKDLKVRVGSGPEFKALVNKAKSQSPPGGVNAPFDAGFAMAPFSSRVRQEFGLPNLGQPKPVVIAVDPNSEAGRTGITPGDVILDVNRNSVSTPKDVVRFLKNGTINIFRILKQDRVVLISLRLK